MGKAAEAAHAEAHAVATAAFLATYEKVAAGEVVLPEAPVHEIPAVVAPAVAPIAYAAPYWNAAYPYAAYGAGYYGFPGYYGYNYGKAAPCVNAANVPVP